MSCFISIAQALFPADIVTEHYSELIQHYQYDPAGELVRTLDKLRGEITYEHEANGQLRSRNTGSMTISESFR